MLDEIEKMSRSYQGDPMAAMLEVLDPDQNDNFTDHYLDAPFSLSEVVFVATANSLDHVPRPLYDRLEVIHLSGYTEEEKVEIAETHIIPKTLRKHGLDTKHAQDTFGRFAQNHPGIYPRSRRAFSLERNIASLCRKVASQVVKKEAESVKMQPNMVAKLSGGRRA